jgi:hypothetical protein
MLGVRVYNVLYNFMALLHLSCSVSISWLNFVPKVTLQTETRFICYNVHIEVLSETECITKRILFMNITAEIFYLEPTWLAICNKLCNCFLFHSILVINRKKKSLLDLMKIYKYWLNMLQQKHIWLFKIKLAFFWCNQQNDLFHLSPLHWTFEFHKGEGRLLVAGFPPRRPGFEPGSGQVGFVVDTVALGQDFSEYFGFPCQSSLHQILHHHNHPGQVQ